MSTNHYFNNPDKYRYIGCYTHNAIAELATFIDYGIHLVSTIHRASVNPEHCIYFVFVDR